MITISLCMIVKNEELVLARCLNSIMEIVDEIIIVDTGSSDSTKEIAQKFTDKVFNFEWVNDFSAARNYSFSKASMDYILFLDADDVVLQEDAIKFKQLKQNFDPSVDIVMMKYNASFDENGDITMSYFRERLSKRINYYSWKEPVHEYLEISGKIINSDVCITHKKESPAVQYRNLKIYENIINSSNVLSLRGIYYYARELYFNGMYDRAIEYFNKFLDNELGWIEDKISTCSCLSTCYSYINDENNAFMTLMKSFQFDTPRAEICCKLGDLFFNRLAYSKAIFWYKLATELEKPTECWGFIIHDYWDYIPNIQLCVCYDKLGDREKAIEYNNKAGLNKPNDPAVRYNYNYFKNSIADK